MTTNNLQHITFLILIIFIACNKQEDEKIEKTEPVVITNDENRVEKYNSDIDSPIEKYKKLIAENTKNYAIQNISEVYLGDNESKYFLCNKTSTIRISEDIIYTTLYVINNDTVIKSHDIGLTPKEVLPNFIMKNISGHFEDTLVAVGDYNNDTINEILTLEFAGSGYRLYINGIDRETKEFIDYCAVLFYSQYPPEFAPVEFIRYKGIDGFKVLMPFELLEMEYPKYAIDGDYDGVGWMFYRWDESSRKYIAVEEVNPYNETIIISTAKGQIRLTLTRDKGIEIINELGSIRIKCRKLTMKGREVHIQTEKKLAMESGGQITIKAKKNVAAYSGQIRPAVPETFGQGRMDPGKRGNESDKTYINMLSSA